MTTVVFIIEASNSLYLHNKNLKNEIPHLHFSVMHGNVNSCSFNFRLLRFQKKEPLR